LFQGSLEKKSGEPGHFTQLAQGSKWRLVFLRIAIFGGFFDPQNVVTDNRWQDLFYFYFYP
jgi:hypothetical protein